MNIIIFLIILGLLVIIHELGHFIAAKKTGVMVEEFGFGFPPRVWSKKKGETLYSLNALPIGGFVKVFGEEYEEIENAKKSGLDPALQQRAFVYKKPAVKTLIIIAGVLMNLVLGVSIFYFLLFTNNFQSDPLPLLSSYKFKFGNQEGKVIAANIIKDSPAYKAGIKSEDIIIRYKVNNDPWKNITSADELINTIKTHPGITISLALENVRNGNQQIVDVVPYYNRELKRAIIGVNLIDAAIIKYETPVQKVFSGFMHSYNVMEYNFSTIGKLLGFAVKEKKLEPVSSAVSGPIGIFSVVNEIVNTSGKKLVNNLLNIIGLLSLSLAVMNILPFPALDGGRLVFVFYEWITGKRVNKTIERYVNVSGFFFLILLAILVSINDIIRLIK